MRHSLSTNLRGAAQRRFLLSTQSLALAQLLNMADTTTQVRSAVELDRPLFHCTPQVVEFAEFTPFTPSNARVSFRNDDSVPRRIRVLQPDSPYFSVEGPFASHGGELPDGRIAPGTEVCYRVRFSPLEAGEYASVLECITERERFLLRLVARGPRAELSMSDVVHFGRVPVNGEATRSFAIHNGGKGATEVTLCMRGNGFTLDGVNASTMSTLTIEPGCSLPVTLHFAATPASSAADTLQSDASVAIKDSSASFNESCSFHAANSSTIIIPGKPQQTGEATPHSLHPQLLKDLSVRSSSRRLRINGPPSPTATHPPSQALQAPTQTQTLMAEDGGGGGSGRASTTTSPTRAVPLASRGTSVSTSSPSSPPSSPSMGSPSRGLGGRSRAPQTTHAGSVPRSQSSRGAVGATESGTAADHSISGGASNNNREVTALLRSTSRQGARGGVAPSSLEGPAAVKSTAAQGLGRSTPTSGASATKAGARGFNNATHTNTRPAVLQMAPLVLADSMTGAAAAEAVQKRETELAEGDNNVNIVPVDVAGELTLTEVHTGAVHRVSLAASVGELPVSLHPLSLSIPRTYVTRTGTSQCVLTNGSDASVQFVWCAHESEVAEAIALRAAGQRTLHAFLNEALSTVQDAGEVISAHEMQAWLQQQQQNDVSSGNSVAGSSFAVAVTSPDAAIFEGGASLHSLPSSSSPQSQSLRGDSFFVSGGGGEPLSSGSLGDGTGWGHSAPAAWGSSSRGGGGGARRGASSSSPPPPRSPQRHQHHHPGGAVASATAYSSLDGDDAEVYTTGAAPPLPSSLIQALPRSLRARLHALKRRFRISIESLKQSTPAPFSSGDWTISQPSGSVWAHSSAEFTVEFNPRACGSSSTVAYLKVTGRARRIPLFLQSEGEGARLEFSYDTVAVGTVTLSSVHRYDLKLDNIGDIEGMWAIAACEDAGDFATDTTASASAQRAMVLSKKHQQQQQSLPQVEFYPDAGSLDARAREVVSAYFTASVLGPFNEHFVLRIPDSDPANYPRLRFVGEVLAPSFHLECSGLAFAGGVAAGFPRSVELSLFNTSDTPCTYRLRVAPPPPPHSSSSALPSVRRGHEGNSSSSSSSLSLDVSNQTIASLNEWAVEPCVAAVEPGGVQHVTLTFTPRTARRYTGYAFEVLLDTFAAVSTTPSLAGGTGSAGYAGDSGEANFDEGNRAANLNEDTRGDSTTMGEEMPTTHAVVIGSFPVNAVAIVPLVSWSSHVFDFRDVHLRTAVRETLTLVNADPFNARWTILPQDPHTAANVSWRVLTVSRCFIVLSRRVLLEAAVAAIINYGA